jgi:hypothetical protein
MVGESYRDCVDRLIGELTAERKDNERLHAELAEERARYTLGGVPPGYREKWTNVALPPPPSAESGRYDGS